MRTDANNLVTGTTHVPEQQEWLRKEACSGAIAVNSVEEVRR